MRILALTSLYPNPYQPHRAPFNQQQFAALAKWHQVRVIAPIAWTDEMALRRRSAKALPLSRRIFRDGLVVDHPRFLFPPKVFRGWHGHFFRRSIRGYFQDAVDEFRPEVVLAAWAYPDGWAAVELAHAAGLPVAIKVHGSDVLLLKQFCPGRRRRTIEALHRADAVIAVSRHLAGEVAALGIDPHKIHVVYNGLDHSRFFPGSRQEARMRLGLSSGEEGIAAVPMALYVGNLMPVKGPDILLEACERLTHRDIRFQCYIIGQGPMKSSLQRKIQQHKLQNWVSLFGSRPLAEIPDWYRATHVLVLPSRSEGLPNVLREALACGTRIVASCLPGVTEMAGAGQISLVPPADSIALAEALERTFAKASAFAPLGLPAQSWSASALALARGLAPVLPSQDHVAARAA